MTDALTTATATAARTVTTAAPRASGLAADFDGFLKLLTTQLRTQTPLDVADANQFTQQLVAFAGVEQQLKGNDKLDGLTNLARASATAAALSTVGRTATASAAEAKLSGGRASWSVTAAAAGTATARVSDASGRVVATLARALPAGASTLAWDGRDAAGKAVPEGTYTLALDARDAAGRSVAAAPEVSGTVEGVSLASGTAVLTIGGREVALDKVRGLSR